MEFAELGPYRILDEIGSGGMGTVFLAESLGGATPVPAGARVAVKVVHPRLLARRGTLARFRREAEVGRRIVHESVVRCLDVGEAEIGGEVHHYLVMEHVEGRTLGNLLEDLGAVPESLLREIARQVAAGLQAIHAHGVVHRDLKPSNVLITADHRVRIMDLGVARLADESVTLTQEGEFAGSLAYAAPELFHGEAATAPADLYALGVTLYELAAGENPFLRDEPSQVIAAQMREDPRPLTDAAPDTTPFFGEIVRTLLAKAPEKRFASAKDLLEALSGGERSRWWAERERALLVAGSGLPTVPVRRETKVHGRDAEMQLLRDRWADAREGRGGTVLVLGEAGIGKTRLVDLFLADLAGRDAHVLYGSYPPSGGIGGLSQAIIEHFGASDLAESLAPYLTVTSRLVPTFAALVKHESPPPGSEPIAGDAIHTVFCHLLRGLAAEKPVVWVVDDIHFAGPDSRKIVLSMARAARGHRVLLVVTTRPGLPDEEMVHFGRLDGLSRANLGRISPRQVVELLRDAFRSEALADQLGARIAYKSDGVPFFVFEMIRGLRDGNFIRRQSDGSFVATRVIERIEVPSAVRDLVAARVTDLTAEERAILDVGAVQGYEFRADRIARVRQMQNLVVLERLASIERRTGVIRSGARGYRFDHHQIQEVLYEGVPPPLRAEYHAALAEAMAGPAGERTLTDEEAVALAHHHLRGSRPERALPWLDRALTHLEISYRNESATDLASRALDVPGLLDGAPRVEMLLRYSERLALAGRTDEVLRVLTAARAEAERLGEVRLQARVLSRLASLHISSSRLDAAEEDLGEAIERARRAGDRKLESEAMVLLGDLRWSREQFDPAGEAYERAIAIARETGDRKREGHAVGGLGNVAIARGRQEDARKHYEEAVRIFLALGDRQLEGWVRGNLGSAYWNLGMIEDAREQYQASLDLAREVGHRAVEGTAVGNLGRTFDFLGRYSEALDQLSRRIAIARETGSVRGEAIALLNIASLRLRMGDHGGAERALDEAEPRIAEFGARGLQAYALVYRGMIAEIRDDPEAAEASFGQAVSIREELGDPAGVASARAARAKLMLRAGEHPAAAEELERALAGVPEEGAGGQRVLTTGLMAAIGRRGRDEAEELYRRWEDRLDTASRMEGRYLLWRAGAGEEHLREARRILGELVDGAPEEHRESMRTLVPLHREILGALPEAVSASEADPDGSRRGPAPSPGR